MNYFKYIVFLLLFSAVNNVNARAILKSESNSPQIEEQSSAEIIRQFMADYEKFILVIRKRSVNRGPAWWMKQNRKYDRLEVRRKNLKEALGKDHKEKLDKWSEEYLENKKHFV